MNIKNEVHAIIGAGNLGLDLNRLFKKGKATSRIFSRSYGFNYPCDLSAIEELSPTVIWLTVGAGSVGECKKDFVRAIDLHIRLVAELRNKFADIPIICFSTDFVASEEYPWASDKRVKTPRSLYALSKLWLEDYAKMVEKVWVIRVGSLYGEWKPKTCFPGKLVQNARTLIRGETESDDESPKQIQLPVNKIGPTPTAWLAQQLIEKFDLIIDNKQKIHHLGPIDNITVSDWGKLILDQANINLPIVDGDIDEDRPPEGKLGSSLHHWTQKPPGWKELWDQYATEVTLGLVNGEHYGFAH